MSKGIWGQLFRRDRKTSFLAWQVELTTRCPLRCRMCIKDSCKDWHATDMSIDDFRSLAPYFKKVKNVVLEGWGEPLLYKDLIEAVRTVKGAGSRPGFITSGWGLNRDYVADLIEGGLDFIGFSLSGATPEQHSAIRINSDLSAIVTAIEDFNRIKAVSRVEWPTLHIVYLLLRENLSEVPLLLDLAKQLRVELVVLINLAQVTNEWQNTQKVFACGHQETSSVIEEARAKAQDLGIALKVPGFSPQPLAACEEDPLNNLFISVDGHVSPCVYLYPPTPDIKRIYCDSEISVEKLTFGNIFRESLDSIWNSDGYRAFRECLSKRRRAWAAMNSLALSVALDGERLNKSGRMLSPEPPVPCRTCHRILGF